LATNNSNDHSLCEISSKKFNLCLDVDLESNKLIVWRCNKNLNQIWHFPVSFDLDGQNSCSIHSSLNLENNDPKKCLNVLENGFVFLKICKNISLQKFYFFKLN
jgi:hypothetical protein